jgi:hypothetical protein
MALNIPMPNLDRNGIFEGLIAGNQIRDRRRQMEMEQKHHENTYAIQQQQQARLAELQPYLIDEYKQKAALQPFIIQKYQEAQQLAPLERQLKMAQINSAISEQAQKEFDQNLIKQFMYGQSGQMGGQPNPMEAPEQEPMGQSQPTMAPPSMAQIQQGFGGQQIHPALAAKMKKLTGWDPNELTPEQKRASDIQQFREKEEIKKQMKGEVNLSAPTRATVTANQSVITAANNIIPQIEQLKKLSIPYAGSGALTSPDKYAKYEAQSNAIADGLMAAFGWPKTDQALQMAKQMVKRKPLESENSYKTRLGEVVKELQHRRTSAHDLLSNSKVKPNSQGQMLKGRINGKEVTIHPSRRELFMEQGGELL